MLIDKLFDYNIVDRENQIVLGNKLNKPKYYLYKIKQYLIKI